MRINVQKAKKIQPNSSRNLGAGLLLTYLVFLIIPVVSVRALCLWSELIRVLIVVWGVTHWHRGHQPMSSQYSVHVITLDQWVRHTDTLTQGTQGTDHPDAGIWVRMLLTMNINQRIRLRFPDRSHSDTSVTCETQHPRSLCYMATCDGTLDSSTKTKTLNNVLITSSWWYLSNLWDTASHRCYMARCDGEQWALSITFDTC